MHAESILVFLFRYTVDTALKVLIRFFVQMFLYYLLDKVPVVLYLHGTCRILGMATAPAGQGVPVVLYLPGTRRILGMATAPAGQGVPVVLYLPGARRIL